jgi:hypothetical protein
MVDILAMAFKDPVFWLAIAVFVFVIAYSAYSGRKDKEKRLEERIRQLEETQKKEEAKKEV